MLHQADYIKYHGSTVGRIKDIFTLENFGTLRAFFTIEPFDHLTHAHDNILDLPTFASTNSKIILGLPAILADRLYMVPIRRDAAHPSLMVHDALHPDAVLHVDWRIKFG